MDKNQASEQNGQIPVLLTLPPSHYCERARWALDRTGIRYIEERLVPGAHILRLKRLGAATTSLPLLLFPDGSMCQGSDLILDRVGLFDGDRKVERRLEEETAPLIRQCLYAGLLSDPQSGIRDVLLRVSSQRQSTIGRLTWPFLKRIMVSGMNARLSVVPDLIKRVDRELDWFESLLSDRGNYLSGDKFGRTDLTAASLLAPIANLQEEPVQTISAGIRWPESLAPAMARWSKRPSVRWVQRTYANERARVVDIESIGARPA